MNNDSNLTLLKITGIICITIGYLAACLHGYDGILLTTVVGIIAAIVGVEVGKYASQRKKEEKEQGEGT